RSDVSKAESGKLGGSCKRGSSPTGLGRREDGHIPTSTGQPLRNAVSADGSARGCGREVVGDEKEPGARHDLCGQAARWSVSALLVVKGASAPSRERRRDFSRPVERASSNISGKGRREKSF